VSDDNIRLEEIVGISSLLDCSLRLEEMAGRSSLLAALEARRFLASAPPKKARARRKERKFIVAPVLFEVCYSCF